MKSKRPTAGLVLTSLLVAFLFKLVPLPEAAAWFRPDVVTLVLMYWWLAYPERIGIYTGFGIGLLLDVIGGSLLGLNGTALILIAWVFLKNYQRIRVLPLTQQSVIVFLALMVKQLIVFWVESEQITGTTESLLHFAPALTGAILWPWLFILLRDLRRRAG
ncbi:MAG: rod shape-determining protein MreD [Pseudomonadota bacterium]